jgi:hypothetical protein
VRLTISPSTVSLLSIKMWEPRLLTSPWAFMACYRDSFTLKTSNLGWIGDSRGGEHEECCLMGYDAV